MARLFLLVAARATRGNFMKTLLLCCLYLLAISATAQLTPNQRNGAFAGYGGVSIVDLTPGAGRPQPPAPPADVQTLKGEVRDTRNNLLLLQVRRYQDGRFAEVLILVTNYPGLDKLTSDQSINTNGKRAGIARDADGDKHELYEYFDLNAYRDAIEHQREQAAQAKADENRAKALAAAQNAKAIALKSNQDAAAKGDMFGLLRMGERYRDGDGVEKDLGKAREYLQKAADAGSPTAKEELSKLNQ